MQCIASSVVFVAMETCSNNPPSCRSAFRVAAGKYLAKPRPADGQIAAFRRHVTIRIINVCLILLLKAPEINRRNRRIELRKMRPVKINGILKILAQESY
jgi:hypothetical protein